MRFTPTLAALVLLAASLPLLAGCRGMHSEKPPIHPNLNMDFSEAFEEQEGNPLFEDGAAMRTPVPGTVARAHLRTTEDAPFYLGRSADGAYVETIPIPVTEALLARGEERYNIYCTPCHGLSGDGQGVIMTGLDGQGYGYVPAPSYHQDYIRVYPDGYLYNVVTNGYSNMSGYGSQIAVPDRWAIVAHVRALQRSQNAAESDVPEPQLRQLESYNPNVSIQ